MNKDFFATLADRAAEYAKRAGADPDVRIEVTLVTGRSFGVDGIVDVADGHVQIDGHDLSEEQLPLSLSVIVPYHQISYVLLTRPKAKTRAGIRAPGS